MTRTQPVTDEDEQLPCYVHNVSEPTEGAFLVCFECGHAYRTAGALRRAYRREYWKVSRDDRFDRTPFWRRLWRIFTVRTSQICFCQHCLHDFMWMPERRRWFRRGGDAT